MIGNIEVENEPAHNRYLVKFIPLAWRACFGQPEWGRGVGVEEIVYIVHCCRNDGLRFLIK